MMLIAMARPIGDGGVSTISSAAGRNASSSRRRASALRNGMMLRMRSSGSTDILESCLQSVQRRIAAAGLDQGFVAAVLDQAAALEGHNAVGRPDGGEPVRDNQHCPALGDFAHVLLDDALALVVERAGRFVEDEDPRVGNERARDRDTLALAAGKRGTAFADDRVVALGQLQNEFMRARELGRRNDAFDRKCRIDQRDVLAHRAVEEHALLQDHADLAPQP